MKLNQFLLGTYFLSTSLYALPVGFVYLNEVDPSIQEELRYASNHNFIGRSIHGYDGKRCIVTKEAALALAKVQAALKPSHLSLKVYDCYRPVAAVQDFIAWSTLLPQQEMKTEFYPRVDKADFFKLGYVAKKSGHNRGSTIDLTIVPINSSSAQFDPHLPLVSCTAPYGKRFKDNSLDMGTGYDCLDPLSHNTNKNISEVAYKNRMFLKDIMEKYGFEPYEKEWWHFSLKNEPYPNTYFNFIVK